MTTPHRLNSDFQLAYFIAGAKHTPDGAYVALYNQWIDMKQKVGCIAAQELRRRARRAAAIELSRSEDELISLNAQADLIEMDAEELIVQKNSEAAKKELAFIEEAMARLKPFCHYADRDILEQGELAEKEEWMREFLFRAENSAVTTGTVSPELIAAMRQHPDFENRLLPGLIDIYKRLTVSTKEDEDLVRFTMGKLEGKPKFLP